MNKIILSDLVIELMKTLGPHIVKQSMFKSPGWGDVFYNISLTMLLKILISIIKPSNLIACTILTSAWDCILKPTIIDASLLSEKWIVNSCKNIIRYKRSSPILYWHTFYLFRSLAIQIALYRSHFDIYLFRLIDQIDDRKNINPPIAML